jgi:hypothetical protein
MFGLRHRRKGGGFKRNHGMTSRLVYGVYVSKLRSPLCFAPAHGSREKQTDHDS